MGTFIGHLVPGLCFVVWAFGAACGTSIRFFQSHSSSQPNAYKNSFCLKGLPVSGKSATLLSAFFVFVGISINIINYGLKRPPEELQHMSMYVGFIIALITQLPLVEDRKLLLPQIEYAAAFLATINEAVLFLFHLHKQSVIESHYHKLLVLSIGLCSLFVALEAAAAVDNVLVGLARSYAFMLHGFWFIVMTFCIYGPFPGGEFLQGEDERNIVIATFLFALTALGVYGFMYVTVVFLRRRVSKLRADRISTGGNNVQM